MAKKVMMAVLKTILCIILIAIISVLIILAVFTYKTEYAKTEIDTSISPDGKYSLTLIQVGEPDFPFGDVKARIILSEGKKKIRKYDTAVSDDGACLNYWKVEWSDGSVEITLDGSEQEPEVIVMEYK